MNTSSKWVLLSLAMGTGWGREVQEPAYARAAWKEEGDLASGWTHGPQTLPWSFLCSPAEKWGSGF